MVNIIGLSQQPRPMVAGVGVCHADAGIITTSTLTTAALSATTLTVFNDQVDGQSVVLVSMSGYGGAGTPVVQQVTPGNGQFTVTIFNTHATLALNAAAQLAFLVIN